MTAYAISLPLIGLAWLTIVFLNERHNLLSCDRFGSAGAKWFAYIWLGLFMVGLAYLVTQAALAPDSARDMSHVPLYAMFVLHYILIVFLLGWWLATGRPPLTEFLNIRHERPLEVVSVGVAVGVGGWMFTLFIAMIVGLLLQSTGLLKEPEGLPPMIGWMASLPVWKKAIIVFMAMTVEEFFFRSFLQKRIGLIASTLLFALAHFTYGQPLLLIGVTVISLIIGLTFYRTRNVLPGVIAHGVFDAVQLFVIVPFAVKMMGG
jgi:membrane protease YdiL (CAAX protease family)